MQTIWKVILLLPPLLSSPAIAGSNVENHPLLKSQEWVSTIAPIRSLESDEQDAVLIGVRGYFNATLQRTIEANKAPDSWYLKTHAIGFCAMAHLANEAASYELLDYFEAECVSGTQLARGEMSRQEYDAKQIENTSLLQGIFERMDLDNAQSRMGQHRDLVSSIGKYILGYSKITASK